MVATTAKVLDYSSNIVLIQTSFQSFHMTTNGINDPLPRPITSKIFTISVPENSTVEIDGHIINGDISRGVYNYDPREVCLVFTAGFLES